MSSSTEERPWGEYTVLLDTPNVKVKRIIVKAGKRLSLQSHKKRHEYWIVVSGNGVFTYGFDVDHLDTELVNQGDNIDIPPGMLHRIEAGGSDLTFIEVQLGAYFGEDDIERFEDDYGRK